MLYYLLWMGVIVVVLLVLRMWQPELIYSFRKLLVNVRTAQALLSCENGAGDGKTTFSQLLLKDLRYETRVDDVTYALKRSMKLRELYQMLDLRREDVPGLPMSGRKPQVCIVELSNLLGNLARKITPDVDYNYPTLGANTLLAFIGSELMKSTRPEKVDEQAQDIPALRAEFAALIAGVRADLAGGDAARAEVERKLGMLEAAADKLTERLGDTAGGNSAGEEADGGLFRTEVETAAWFTKNPMSIEQIIEIMIAAVNGLAYRQFARTQAQKEAVPGSFFIYSTER